MKGPLVQKLGRGWFGLEIKRNVAGILEDLCQVDGISLPVGKKQERLLGRHLQNATQENPLAIYVGSCPDYSHNGDVYTHEGIGGGVPLLTKLHLEHDVKILKVLQKHSVPFTFTIMVADVEAEDQVFCDRFTGGKKTEFVVRCEESVESTRVAISNLGTDPQIRHKMKSSSFFQEFGREVFLGYQKVFGKILSEMYAQGEGVKSKIEGDVLARRSLYQKMYGHLLDDMNINETQTFLVQRTIRTMAQYLSLGRLIGEENKYPAIINHPTRNITIYNQRNKYRFPGDIVGQQLPIPIFRMNKEVY